MTTQHGRSRQLLTFSILLVLAMLSVTTVSAIVEVDYANLEKRGTGSCSTIISNLSVPFPY